MENDFLKNENKKLKDKMQIVSNTTNNSPLRSRDPA